MGISGMKNYPHLQLQLKNQSYVPMAPVPDFSCCVGFINLEIGKRRNLGILIFEKVCNLKLDVVVFITGSAQFHR